LKKWNGKGGEHKRETFWPFSASNAMLKRQKLI
jgi:hypothetical protein